MWARAAVRQEERGKNRRRAGFSCQRKKIERGGRCVRVPGPRVGRGEGEEGWHAVGPEAGVFFSSFFSFFSKAFPKRG